MEPSTSEHGRSDSISDQTYLFPVVSSSENKPCSRPCLFPSAQTAVIDTKPNKGQNWLENKSFTSETAQRLVEFQHELRQCQQKNESAVDDLKYAEDIRGIQNSMKAIPILNSRQSYESERSTIDICLNAKKKHNAEDTRQHVHKKKKRKKHYSSESDSFEHSRRKDASDESDMETVKKKKKAKKHKRKKTYSREVKESEHKRKKDDLPGLFDSKQIFAEEISDIAPAHAFKLDRAPDKNSWTYGSLYSGHIANYKTACNQCVGSDGKGVFMKDLSKKQKDKQSIGRYYSKENRKRVKEAASEVVPKDSCKTESLEDYICVIDVSSDINCDRNKDIRDKVLDEATSLYVSGEGKPLVDQSMSDLQSAAYHPLRHDVSEFNKKLRETPDDIDLWMKFIEFQDRCHGNGHMIGTDSKEKTTAIGIFEKKISILEKALVSNPGNIELLLAKIKLSSEISDSTKVNKDIEDLLFVHPANAQLWQYYLTFNQSRLSSFSVPKMAKLYHKCFNSLFGILEGKVLTVRKSDNLEQEIIDIFLQYCYFLKQTGCKENAIAVFQAFIEFNFFVPESLKNASKEERMAAFEEFWDRNCARIGSKEALGWSKWLEMGKPENYISLNNESLEELEENIIEEKLPTHTTWLKIEHLRDNYHWLPWQPGQGQTLDDCGEEDLERLFLFDDIKPVLFTISKNNHLQFVLSYLKFLGFQSEINITGADKQDNIFCEHLNDVMCNIPVDKSCSAQNALHIQKRDLPRQIAINTLSQLLPCFADAEKSQMTMSLSCVNLSTYSGIDLSKQDKKEMRKIFKNILKAEHNRNDLNVWCSYIELERSIGKTGEALSIVETVLTMHSGESVENCNEKVNGIISVFIQYCEIVLNIVHHMPCKMLPRISPVSMDTKNKIMCVLGVLADSKKFSSKDPQNICDAAVLRVLTKYSKLCSNASNAVCSGKSKLLEERLRKLIWCHCLCMFCKGDINASVDNYLSLLPQTTKSRSDGFKQLELQLTLDKLRMIVYYLSTSSISLHVLRDHLDTALGKFPDNPILLSLFVDVERMSRITGRLNRHFDRWCRIGNSAIPVVYAVINQFAVQEQAGSTGMSGLIHRGRTWLENCLSQNLLQHCVLLWRIYLQLEKVADDAKRTKGVFYRAVQHCPWAKIIYTDAIQLFGDDQLHEIVDLMTEKHLHVQIPVEELDILTSS